jgi:signal transduction histidine kinase
MPGEAPVRDATSLQGGGLTTHLAFAILAAVFPFCSLAGWFLGQPLLSSFMAGRPALSPMTAIGLLLAAVAAGVLPRHARLCLALGAAQTLLGACIVAANLLGWGAFAGFPLSWWSSKFTAALLALSGASTVLLASRHYAFGQALGFGVLMLSGLMALGHVVPQADLYKVLPGTGVAIPTVLGLAAVSISQILACRTSGFVGALGSRTIAGRTGRRLLFSGAGLVLTLSLLFALAYRFDLTDAESAILLIGWSSVTILGVTLWSLAVAVDRAESARMNAERVRDQQRDLITAALSHDIRSPLQAAAMSAVLLHRMVADEQALRAIERLQRSHRRIDRMLRSLLDALTLGSGGTLHLRADAVVLHDVVEEIISENAGILGGRVAWEGRAQGWWDKDAVYRVVENLLLNAAKYATPLTPIWCRISVQDNVVYLAVENSGAPIPRDRWESIFEPFQRGRHDQHASLPGWGVGLAFAKVVADRHGGRIGVAASNADVTVFELVLPMDCRPALDSPRRDSPPAQ